MTENNRDGTYPAWAAWLTGKLDERGCTTVWLARQVGVSAGAIWAYTKGRYLPRYEHIKPLARALGCHPRDIVNAILADLE